jgi:hypothetical protein
MPCLKSKKGLAEQNWTLMPTLGAGMLQLLEYTDQVAVVSGFANSMQSLKNVPIVKAALSYDHPETGEVIVLIINQAIYFGDQLDEILLNPNQIRAYGNVVDDVPIQFRGASHSIISPTRISPFL